MITATDVGCQVSRPSYVNKLSCFFRAVRLGASEPHESSSTSQRPWNLQLRHRKLLRGGVRISPKHNPKNKHIKTMYQYVLQSTTYRYVVPRRKNHSQTSGLRSLLFTQISPVRFLQSFCQITAIVNEGQILALFCGPLRLAYACACKQKAARRGKGSCIGLDSVSNTSFFVFCLLYKEGHQNKNHHEVSNHGKNRDSHHVGQNRNQGNAIGHINFDNQSSEVDYTESDDNIVFKFWFDGSFDSPPDARAEGVCHFADCGFYIYPTAGNHANLEHLDMFDLEKFQIETDGEDGLWIDQIRIYNGESRNTELAWGHERAWTFGSDNWCGWCLSTDPSDAWRSWEGHCVENVAYAKICFSDLDGEIKQDGYKRGRWHNIDPHC